MSFLIWSSLLVVSAVGWVMLVRGLADLRQGFESRWWASGQQGFWKSFWRLLVSLFLQPSWASALSDIMALGATQVFPRRNFLAGLALLRMTSVVALLVVGTLLLNVNSSYLLLLGALLWSVSRWWRVLQPWALVALSVGILLLGFEFSIKQSSILYASAMELPFLFTLGDSLWSTIATAFCFAFLFGFIVQLSGFGFLAAAILVLTGLASLPSALALALGDIAGLWFYFVWVFRKSALWPDQLWRYLLFFLSAVICFSGFSFLQEIVRIIFPGAYSPELRFEQFVILVGMVFFIETLISIVFFFFLFRKTSKFVDKSPVVIPQIQEDFLSTACKEAIRRKIIRTLV